MDTTNKTLEVISATFFDDRFYRVRVGEDTYHYIASVTTKLSVERKEGIERWRGDISNREADLRMNEASHRGKRIHYAWWVYTNVGTVVYNPWESPIYSDEDIKQMKESSTHLMVLNSQDEMLQVWKLQQFFEIVKPKVLASELIVYSVKEDIAGTMDNAFLIEKGTYPVSGSKGLVIPKTGIYIADLKTGKFLDDHVWRQLAPYAVAYREMNPGIEIAGALVMHTAAQTKSGIQGLAVLSRTAEELKEDFEDYKHLAAIWKKNNPNAGPRVFDFPSIIRRTK